MITAAIRAPAGNLARLVGELEAALRSNAPARMQLPMRQTLPAETTCLAMTALAPELDLYLAKVATITPRPPGDARPAITAIVVAFSAATGELRAILDGAAVTALKCAAVSALVTDRCAAPDAHILAIAGTGVQARQQARAVREVRPITELRVWSRSLARATAFARELDATPYASLDDAVRGADIIATATMANTPLAAFTGLPPHVHINCMGGHTPEARELPRELLATSTLIVEHRATAIAEAGPLHAAALELTELVHADPAALRATRTIFSSTGHAFLDVLTTAHLLREPTP